MTLFHKPPHHYHANPGHTSAPGPGIRRRVIVIEEARVLPDHLRRLDLLCKHPAHPLPCKLRYVNDGATRNGHPFARYRCPLCGAEQGWGTHYQTGQALRLFMTDPRR